MIEYLGHTPDTTTEEFDQVWRDIDPETKEVRPLRFPIIAPSHPIADLGEQEQGSEGNQPSPRCRLADLPITRFGGRSPPDLIPYGPTWTFLNIHPYAYFCSGLHLAYHIVLHT